MPPTVADGTCYVGVDRRPPDEFTGLVAVGTDGGTESWRRPVDAGHTVPTTVGETVFFTAVGATHALDRTTGDLRWRYAEGYGYPEAAPVVTDEVCYVPTDRVTALDAVTGELLWETDELAASAGIAVADGTVYATTIEPEPGCVALDASDGRVRWSNAAAGASHVPPVVTDDRVVVVGEGGPVVAFSRAGEVVWERNRMPQLHTPVAVADGTAYLATDDADDVSAYALSDGTRRWRQSLGPTVDRTPAVTDETVYAVGWDRETQSDAVLALDPATGAERNRVPLGADATTGVVVGREALFVSVERQTVGQDGSPHAVFRVS
jgi:outer membrane protein assembly factor BamB